MGPIIAVLTVGVGLAVLINDTVFARQLARWAVGLVLLSHLLTIGEVYLRALAEGDHREAELLWGILVVVPIVLGWIRYRSHQEKLSRHTSPTHSSHKKRLG